MWSYNHMCYYWFWSRAEELYKWQSIRTWAGPRLSKYCSITVPVNQSLRPGWCLNYQDNTYNCSQAIWRENCKHHTWYHHSLLLSWSYFTTHWVKSEDWAAHLILQAWTSLPGLATIMYKTDQSSSNTWIILGGISHSTRHWTLGTECWIHITD